MTVNDNVSECQKPVLRIVNQRGPVIALLADAMPIDVERGLAAGFLRYLTKPVSLPRLMEALEQVMTGRG